MGKRGRLSHLKTDTIHDPINVLKKQKNTKRPEHSVQFLVIVDLSYCVALGGSAEQQSTTMRYQSVDLQNSNLRQSAIDHMCGRRIEQRTAPHCTLGNLYL